MSKKSEVSRAFEAIARHAMVRFSFLKTDEKRFGHREEKDFKENELEGLMNSLVQEGQMSETTVVQEGEFYLVIGGHRRYYATRFAIQKNADPTRFHMGMEVPVVILEKGSGQSDADFNKDIFVRSVAENENREKMPDAKKLEIIQRGIQMGISDMRIQNSLGTSDSDYKRKKKIATTPELLDAYSRGYLSISQAGTLAEKLISERIKVPEAKRTVALRASIVAWTKHADKEIEKYKAEMKRLAKETDADSLKGAKYLSSGKLKAWTISLAAGEVYDCSSSLGFDVKVDPKTGKLFIPSVNRSVAELDADTVESIIKGLIRGQYQLAQVLDEKRQAKSTERTKSLLAELAAAVEDEDKPDGDELTEDAEPAETELTGVDTHYAESDAPTDNAEPTGIESASDNDGQADDGKNASQSES